MMNKEELYEAIGDINEKYVRDANAAIAKEKKRIWMKWGIAVACLCVLLGVWQSGVLESKKETVTLESGESIHFYRGDMVAGSLDLSVERKNLTKEELQIVFGDLSVTEANAVFTLEKKLIGLEGRFNDMKFVVSMPGLNLMDTVIVGEEKQSVVAGAPVIAGYFVTKANSKGIKTAIYYATIELDDYTIYMENAGTEAESAVTKDKLVRGMEQLIPATLDFGKIQF